MIGIIFAADEAHLPRLCLSSGPLGGSPVRFVRIAHTHSEGDSKKSLVGPRGLAAGRSLGGTRWQELASCSVFRTLAVGRARHGGRFITPRGVAHCIVIESVRPAATGIWRAAVRSWRAGRVERARVVVRIGSVGGARSVAPECVRRGPPNHTLEATAYRTALRLLVRLGLFCLPMRLTFQGCASALIR